MAIYISLVTMNVLSLNLIKVKPSYHYQGLLKCLLNFESIELGKYPN